MFLALFMIHLRTIIRTIIACAQPGVQVGELLHPRGRRALTSSRRNSRFVVAAFSALIALFALFVIAVPVLLVVALVKAF